MRRGLHDAVGLTSLWTLWAVGSPRASCQRGEQQGSHHEPGAITPIAPNAKVRARASRPGRRPLTRPASVGGVVIGGGYLGLGIARTLGRRGVPVCVVDDERSASAG